MVLSHHHNTVLYCHNSFIIENVFLTDDHKSCVWPNLRFGVTTKNRDSGRSFCREATDPCASFRLVKLLNTKTK